jgi:hypothetical protein
MKRAALSSCFGFIALLTLAIGLAANPAQATSIGVLPTGGSYSDTITSSGPTFSQNYDFTLESSVQGLTVLATAFGQTSPTHGVDLLEIALYDSASNLIASASGSPIAFFDSFDQSGIALGAGAYLFSVFGQVTAGKTAFVSISLAANTAQTPIPAAGLLLLTGLGALGGLAARRRASAGKTTASAS